MKQTLSVLACFILAMPDLLAQAEDAAVADDGHGVVLTVLAIIFLGLFAFLFATERKLSRIEKEMKEK